MEGTLRLSLIKFPIFFTFVSCISVDSWSLITVTILTRVDAQAVPDSSSASPFKLALCPSDVSPSAFEDYSSLPEHVPGSSSSLLAPARIGRFPRNPGFL